ncbi:hypothetical protein B488_13050 [Liberibacter crescens BT-1]|uniref:RNA 2-O ribose methyltransferase substrate binding domain-containing protein n=1 Tax=Liberibacter crescens (strain BT-1) TaxID=1215343 RepID=L0EWG0_LIBCB|nr:RNA methyltransferase [Liberibacter crescens]AGA65297.1 hypothetical protein B488_13050 [Liberibacter crescens BT-1]AMC13230.1 RNA methyltransferase [Liberibacter crescens]
MNKFYLKKVKIKNINSVSNPLIKNIRALTRKKERKKAGVFIAEGLKLIIDAINLGWSATMLVYTKSMKENSELLQTTIQAITSELLIIEVSEKIMSSLSRRDNPQNVLGIFTQRLIPLQNITIKGDETWVALDRIRDPGNLGTIIRTIDASGASGVILIGETTDPYGIETVRATMGSIFKVPIVYSNIDEFISWVKKSQAFIIATHLQASIDYRTVEYPGKSIILLMGNEKSGLSNTFLSIVDKLVRIPQAGTADSLNVSIATGIMLFEIRRHLLFLETH